MLQHGSRPRRTRQHGSSPWTRSQSTQHSCALDRQQAPSCSMPASTTAMDWMAKQKDGQGCKQADKSCHQLTSNIRPMIFFDILHGPMKSCVGKSQEVVGLSVGGRHLGRSSTAKRRYIAAQNNVLASPAR
eukprot:scaffold51601_cov18-Tisochrysis_lutea.AAC.1